MGENKEFQHIIIFVAKRRSGGPHWFVGELLQFWCSEYTVLVYSTILKWDLFNKTYFN